MTKKVLVKNLTKEPSDNVKAHALDNARIPVGKQIVDPGNSVEIDDDPFVRKQLAHFERMGAVAVEEVKARPARPKAEPPPPEPTTQPVPVEEVPPPPPEPVVEPPPGPEEEPDPEPIDSDVENTLEQDAAEKADIDFPETEPDTKVEKKPVRRRRRAKR